MKKETILHIEYGDFDMEEFIEYICDTPQNDTSYDVSYDPGEIDKLLEAGKTITEIDIDSRADLNDCASTLFVYRCLARSCIPADELPILMKDVSRVIVRISY